MSGRKRTRQGTKPNKHVRREQSQSKQPQVRGKPRPSPRTATKQTKSHRLTMRAKNKEAVVVKKDTVSGNTRTVSIVRDPRSKTQGTKRNRIQLASRNGKPQVAKRAKTRETETLTRTIIVDQNEGRDVKLKEGKISMSIKQKPQKKPIKQGESKPSKRKIRFSSPSEVKVPPPSNTNQPASATTAPAPKVYVREPQRRVEGPQTAILIRNLHPDMTGKELVMHVFRDDGDIVSAVVQTDENGVSLGVAEVVFASRTEAEEAIKNHANDEVLGKKLRLCFVEQEIAAPPPLVKVPVENRPVAIERKQPAPIVIQDPPEDEAYDDEEEEPVDETDKEGFEQALGLGPDDLKRPESTGYESESDEPVFQVNLKSKSAKALLEADETSAEPVFEVNMKQKKRRKPRVQKRKHH